MIDKTYKGRKVLITGGAGFIGSNLAARLVSYGAQVTLVDNFADECGGNLFNVEWLGDRIRLNISDLRDESSLRYLLEGKDFIFNLAGKTSHLDSMDNPYRDIETNCLASLAILEACRKINPSVKIVYASTRQIYGKPDFLPVDEKHLLRPVDVNGINKMAGEWYHILYNNVHGIRACALRLTNTYGPRMRVKDARQTFLGVWLRLVIQEKTFEVWGGEQLRDFTYVDDAVDAFIMAAACDESNGQIYNLGGESVVSLKELAENLIAANGGGRFVIRDFPSDRKAIDIGDYYANFESIRKALGWYPRINLIEGITKSLSYYRNNLKYYV
jgi:UDP-glucose 4-epimerase